MIINYSHMANISCDVTISVNRTEWKTPTDVILGLGAASLMISCLDIGAFFAMKLHRKVIYRLAMYQLVSSVVLEVSMSGDALVVRYASLAKIAAYSCLLFLTTTKHMFNMWLTIHVFVFAVYYENKKELEPMYIITALLVPLILTLIYVVAAVALECKFDVLNKGGGVLLFIDLMIVALASALVLVLVITLLRRLCCTRRIRDDRYYRLALSEIVLFLGYSILTLFSTVPIYSVAKNWRSDWPVAVYIIVPETLNVVNALLFMAHALVLLASKKCRKRRVYAAIVAC